MNLFENALSSLAVPAENAGLRVIIVGPEGSGKTVLAAVLADYLESHPQFGLQLRAGGFETREYCSDVLTQLRAGSWPNSTRQGSLRELEWQWGLDGSWHSVKLIDPAGQDVREELIGKTSGLQLAERTRKSDLVILVVDPVSHHDSPPVQRTQNGWIVEHVLQGFQPDRMNLLVVLTKADALSHRLSEGELGNREAVLHLLDADMPEGKFGAYRIELAHANCAAVAVAAVVADLEAHGGISRTVPSVPLRSLGMPSLVGELVKAMRAVNTRTNNQRQTARDLDLRREATAIRQSALLGLKAFAVPIVVLLLLAGGIAGYYFRALPATPATGTPVSVICPTCGGSGKERKGWSLWLYKGDCSTCGGSGSVQSKIIGTDGSPTGR